jgi:hypothetical protein
MPLEIRELVIKATVVQDGPAGSAAASGQGAGAPEEIIQACVEKVLDILKEKNER